MRDVLEGVGWVIFGIGGGFFLVTGLRSGDTFTIVMSAIVLLAVAAGVVFALRRQSAQAANPQNEPVNPDQ